MAQDLSGLYISQSFQNLVQSSASGAFNVLATATGTEFIPVSASYAISSSHAVDTDNAISSSHAINADVAISSSHAVNSDSAISSSYALTSSYAENVVPFDSGSLLVTASIVDATLTFTKGDASVFPLTVNNVANATSALLAVSASHAVNADNAISSSHALNADNAISSSYALTASFLDGAVDAFPFTGSAQITGSLGVTGSMVVSLNEPGTNATLTIKDDAQSSYNDGPTLTFEGSNVGIIKSQAATNMQIKAERDLEIFVGQGGAGSQFKIFKTDNAGGDFIITDYGSRSAIYNHENINETGSINFANTSLDVGIGLEMDDNKMELSMYSGSIFVPIIGRKANTREINIYDSTFSTGSSSQVLTSNANGGIEWAAGGGGGAAFPYTGSAQITGSLAVTGSTTIRGPLSSGGANAANTLAAGAAAALGSNNTVNSTDAAIVGGAGHTVTGDTSVIVGGESNIVNSGYSGIFGAASSTITNGDTSVILGGYQQSLQGARTYLLGGNSNSISNSGADYSGIIGGQSHAISTAVTASAIIAGKSITATENETVYIPNLNIQAGKKLTMSGSIELASSTGSVGQVIGVDALGNAKWEAGGGGGAAFPFTGSAEITGSLKVIGGTMFEGGVQQQGTGFSTYFGLNSGTAALVAPIGNKFSTAYGVGTLAAATGQQNAAFGGDALNENTTGGNNSAFGLGVLKKNLTGGSNTAMGWQALNLMTSGDNNVALGRMAGTEIVSTPGNTNFTSNTSVFIGRNAFPLNNGELNQIVIGDSAEGHGTNTVTLGNNSITDTHLKGDIHITGSVEIRGPLSAGGANGANTLAAGAAAALGSNNTVNSTDSAILGGTSQTLTGEASAIVGGEGNSINSGYTAILGATYSSITNGNTSVILGGYQQSLQGTYTYLLGGNQNSVSNSGAEFSGIIGGQSNSIATAITASAILGGKNITATKSETVYVPNLEVVSGGIRIPSGGGTINPGLVLTGSALNNVVIEYVISNTASIQLNESNTFEIDADAGNTHLVPVNINKGQVVNIQITQNAAGGGTITFDPEFKFPGGTAPTLTATANAIDILSCVSYDGTTLLTNATQNYS